MRWWCKFLLASVAVMAVPWTIAAERARAAISEPAADPALDPAPCLADAATNSDSDRIIASCGALIGSEKTPRPDRVKALIARAAALAGKGLDDRAIADYDVALRLDPGLADGFNARGELWRRKGNRPRALADFGAALKVDPQHVAARDNYRSLARELERLGAQLAVRNKPSFNCATARRAVEKAICADPDLANLDREIDAAHTLVMQEAARSGARAGHDLQRQQDAFLAQRNASFGRPGYDLHKAMKARLQQLLGRDGY